jgi:hypothetical protein
MGATATKAFRDSMGGAAMAFFIIWFTGRAVLHPEGPAALHLLFAAYYAHLAFRTFWLTFRYRRDILGAIR